MYNRSLQSNLQPLPNNLLATDCLRRANNRLPNLRYVSNYLQPIPQQWVRITNVLHFPVQHGGIVLELKNSLNDYSSGLATLITLELI